MHSGSEDGNGNIVMNKILLVKSLQGEDVN